MNPAIDVGQVEGAFVFGMGYWLTEKYYYDPETGQELSTGTWVRRIIIYIVTSQVLHGCIGVI
jgi:xanthine dehydrogenase molybdopterin-binding subunit B